jgi:hypothetical protein
MNNLEFTFGIITNGKNDIFISEIIDSIKIQKIKNYEIILVGNSKIKGDNIKLIEFNDKDYSKPWITRKKNIITLNSTYSNIVYLHDYIKFCDGWYEGYQEFGNNFNVCTNIIKNLDDTRFRDWTIDPWSYLEVQNIVKRINVNNTVSLNCLLPYNITHLSKFMYISGSYWIAKKNIMESFPLNEKLYWNEGEDLMWSKSIRKYHDFKLNIHSSVKLLKHKEVIFDYVDNDIICNLNLL